jgi:hypothetical protein
MVMHKKIVMAAPPLTEHEKGFELWLTKIAKLAQELSIPIQLFCNEATQKAIEKLNKNIKLPASINISPFNDWDDFLILSRNLHENDLFVLVSARRGTASYMAMLENLPSKLEKHFSANSRLLIYPQQYSQNNGHEGYEDIMAEPLNKGIETIQKIGKGIGNIFKKDSAD